MLNEDYREMLQALVDEKARFLLVGAYALAAHGYPRATMDIDIWVMPSPANTDAVLRAPRRIDIITAASGLQFDEAFSHSTAVVIEGLEVHIPSVADLIVNKWASGRTKDLADAEALEKLESSQQVDSCD